LRKRWPLCRRVPEHLTDEDVLGALRQIPETYQEVILLCDVQEMTYKELRPL
jgi:DNA-directed RNA polymerase specialized sigma24 family protein